MRQETIKRIFFDSVKEIEALPDGTIVMTDCYSGIGWFEKTPDGLEQNGIGIPWKKVNCNDFYIEIEGQTEIVDFATLQLIKKVV